MKKLAIILLMLTASAIALANPVWAHETIVRDGQNIVFQGDSVRDNDGNVVSFWVQDENGESHLMANKFAITGALLWAEPSLVRGGEKKKEDIKVIKTWDGNLIVGWIENLDRLHYTLKVQMIGPTGALLWSEDGVSVAETYDSHPNYVICPTPENGAYLFVNHSPSLVHGHNLDSSGSDQWASNPRTIQGNGFIELQELLSPEPDYGVMVYYQLVNASGKTNYFRRYNRSGYSSNHTWEQSYAASAEEEGKHQIFFSYGQTIYDIVKVAWTDTRIRIRTLDFVSGSNHLPMTEFVVNSAPVSTATIFKATVSNNVGPPSILCASLQNGSSEIREYHLNYQLEPIGEGLFYSGSGLIQELDYYRDNTGKRFFAWVEAASPDGDRVLKAQAIDNITAEIVWPASGLVLSPALEKSSGFGICAKDSNMLALFAEPGIESKTLRRQAINYAGDALLSPEEEMFATALKGYALPHRSLQVGDRNIIIYSDTRNDDVAKLYYRQLDEYGEAMPEPGEVLICSGAYATPLLLDAVVCQDDLFAVLYYSNGLYLKTFDSSGNCIPQDGLLLATQPSTYSNSARLAFYEGDIYACWAEQGENNYRGIKGQRISNAVLMWGNSGITVADQVDGNSRPGAPEGRYFTWHSPLTNGIHCRRLDIDGVPEPGWYPNGSPIFQTDSTGRFYPTWTALSGENLLMLAGGRALDPIYAQKVLPDASLPWGNGGISMHDDYHHIKSGFVDASGFAIGYLSGDWQERGIHLQLLDSEGNFAYDAPGMKLDSAVPYSTGGMAVSRFADGNVLAVWSASYDADNQEMNLYYRRMSQWGEMLDYSPKLLCTSLTLQDMPFISQPSLSSATVTWADARAGQTENSVPRYGIFAQMITSGPSSVPDQPDIPAALWMDSCYPNPFTASTNIRWTQKDSSPAQCSIYNLKGQLVKRLSLAAAKAGENQTLWNGDDEQGRKVSSGIYFIRLQSGKESLTKKVLRMP